MNILCELLLFFTLSCTPLEEAIDVIRKAHFRQYVVVNTLLEMDKVKPGAYSEDAVELMMGTAVIESKRGQQLVQFGKGPARGAFQVEGMTHIDIWDNYLRYQDELRDYVYTIMSEVAMMEVMVPNTGEVIAGLKNSDILDTELTVNLRYNATMARIKYLRSPKPLPSRTDPAAMGDYWEVIYQGDPSRTIGETAQDFVDKYLLYGRTK